MLRMFLIEKITNDLANKIAFNLNLDEDKRDVIAYGAFNLFQTIWCIIVVLILGIIFNVAVESLVVSLAIAVLRKYSGGVHSSSPNRCAVIGAIVSVGLALLMIKIEYLLSIQYIIVMMLTGMGFSYYIIGKLAPVDSPAKPILREEKRLRMKKYSIRVLNIVLMITVVLLIFCLIRSQKDLIIIIMCIQAGVVWQSATLISKVALVVKSIDNFFKAIATL